MSNKGKYALNKYLNNRHNRRINSWHAVKYRINKHHFNKLDKYRLESLVIQEIAEHNISLSTNVTTMYYSEIHPESDNDHSSIYVQINIGNTNDISTNVINTNDIDNVVKIELSKSSYLDFYYTPKFNRIEHINIKLIDTLKGGGYGRLLVESMESVGRKLGCAISRVNININQGFWDHMGYKFNGEYWDKSLQ